jgi:diaminopimelate epimerase
MVEISFCKMHGLGNDYVIIDNRNETLKDQALSDMAKELCERRYSVGADGVLLIHDSAIADVKMRILNADGSIAELCGNGMRCFAKYCYEKDIIKKRRMTIDTLDGVKDAWVYVKGKKVQTVKINMGEPHLLRKDIPMHGEGTCINEKLRIDGEVFEVTCLSMGNPHCVIFVDSVDDFPVHKIGKKIENHSLFPNRTNVEFVEVLNRKEIKMRVWERGCGETLACGTGACASIVAGNLLGCLNNKCVVHLLGGDLKIDYDNVVMMEGEAEKTFEGILEVKG